jgi:hypothetical protein
MASNQYTVTANTVLSFDFYSSTRPEIAAIGLDNNNGFSPPTDFIRYIQLAGTDTGGRSAAFRPA